MIIELLGYEIQGTPWEMLRVDKVIQFKNPTPQIPGDVIVNLMEMAYEAGKNGDPLVLVYGFGEDRVTQEIVDELPHPDEFIGGNHDQKNKRRQRRVTQKNRRKQDEWS